jgi:nucleotide-binding universal stress UspA family protein
MTHRIVVGSPATPAGADAVALAARLAAATGAELELVIVLPGDSLNLTTPPDAQFDDALRSEAAGWLAEVAAAIPASVVHREHVRFADSFGAGLIYAATEYDADLIVVGAAGGGRNGRHRLGTVADELLHTSPVAVALAPDGSRSIDPLSGVSRVTAAVGTRKGKAAVLGSGIAYATAAHAPLRLVSLVTIDLPASVDTGVIRLAEVGHTEELLQKATRKLPAGVHAEVVVGTGDNIEGAVEALSWQPGEVAVVGSSRLARKRRLFLGSTAARILRALPVPMIVVPRSRD